LTDRGFQIGAGLAANCKNLHFGIDHDTGGDKAVNEFALDFLFMSERGTLGTGMRCGDGAKNNRAVK